MASSSSSSGANKKKPMPTSKPKRGSINQVLSKMTSREVEVLDSGSESGSVVIHDEVGGSYLDGAQVVAPEVVWGISGLKLEAKVKFSGMALASTEPGGGTGLVVSPKGFTHMVLFPCLHQEITEEEFQALHEEDHCRCVQTDSGQIYYMPADRTSGMTEIEGGSTLVWVNAYLANAVEVCPGPSRANCDYVVLTDSDRGQYLEHFPEVARAPYSTVRVLLRTSRKTQKGSKLMIPAEPLCTQAMQAAEEAERLAAEAAERELDSDYSESPGRKKRRVEGVTPKRHSERTVLGPEARIQAAVDGRIHAYERSLLDQIQYLAARFDHVVDSSNDSKQRGHQHAAILRRLEDKLDRLGRERQEADQRSSDKLDTLLKLVEQLVCSLGGVHPVTTTVSTSKPKVVPADPAVVPVVPPAPTPIVPKVVPVDAEEEVDYEPASDEEE